MARGKLNKPDIILLSQPADDALGHGLHLALQTVVWISAQRQTQVG
jgi:hypothetical protein